MWQGLKQGLSDICFDKKKPLAADFVGYLRPFFWQNTCSPNFSSHTTVTFPMISHPGTSSNEVYGPFFGTSDIPKKCGKVSKCTLYPVGGWTSQSEKYARQIGSFPQGGVKIRNIWDQHPESPRYKLNKLCYTKNQAFQSSPHFEPLPLGSIHSPGWPTKTRPGLLVKFPQCSPHSISSMIACHR